MLVRRGKIKTQRYPLLYVTGREYDLDAFGYDSEDVHREKYHIIYMT